MKNLLKKALIITLVIIVVLLIYLWFDDPLTPLSKQILGFEVKHQPTDNGEVFIWCFACKSDDVYTSATSVIKSVNEHIAEKKPYDEFVFDFETYGFAGENVLCEKFENDCDIFQIIKELDNKKFIKEYTWAITRYQMLLKFDYHTPQVYPYYDAPLQSYENIGKAQRTFHLSLFLEQNVKGTNILINSLTEELVNLKQNLSQTSSLISKMVIVALISENLELMNQLNQNKIVNYSELSEYVLVLALSLKHYDLSDALKRHYVAWVNAYKEKSDISNSLEKKNGSPINKIFLKFLYKVVYKPNMTTNYITQDLELPLSLTKLNPQLFFQQAQNQPDKEEMNQFRNYLGRRALNKVKPLLTHEYIARIHSLHNKMVLLRSLIHFGSLEAIKKNIDDKDFPYRNLFNNELPYFEDNHFCFGSLEGIRVRPEDICLKIVQP